MNLQKLLSLEYKKVIPYFLPFVGGLGLLLFLIFYNINLYKQQEEELLKKVELLFTNLHKEEENKIFKKAIDSLFIEVQEIHSNSPGLLKDNRTIKTTNQNEPMRIQFENTDVEIKVKLETSEKTDLPKTINLQGIDTTNNIRKVVVKKMIYSDTQSTSIFVANKYKDSSVKSSNNAKFHKPIQLNKTTNIVESQSHNQFPNFVSNGKNYYILSPNIDTLKVKFDSLLFNHGINITYSIDSLPLEKGLKKPIVYTAVAKSYKEFILRKISPQILLTSLVFFSVLFGYISVFKTMKKQKKLSKERENFLSNMTHELKTPISIVNIALESIQSFDTQNDPEKRKEYLQIARQENDKLLSVIDNILKLSNQEMIHFTTKENINIKNLVNEILNSFKPILEKKQIQIDCEIKLKNEQFLTNKHAITYILQNLIDNGIKYNDKPFPKINLIFNSNDDALFISVCDNGRPISKEEKSKIFEQFYRISKDNTHNVKGYGIGLYLTKQYIEAMKGNINLESTAEGNNFIINIPLSTNA